MYKINLDIQKPISWDFSPLDDSQRLSVGEIIQNNEEKIEHSDFSKVLHQKSHSEELDTLPEKIENSLDKNSQGIDNSSKNLPVQNGTTSNSEIISLHLFRSTFQKKAFLKNKLENKKESSKKQPKFQNLQNPINFFDIQNLNIPISKNLILQKNSHLLKQEELGVSGTLQSKKQNLKQKENNSLKKCFTEPSKMLPDLLKQNIFLNSLSDREAVHFTKNEGVHSIKNHLLNFEQQITNTSSEGTKHNHVAKNHTNVTSRFSQNLEKQDFLSFLQTTQIDPGVSGVEHFGKLESVVDLQTDILKQVVFQISKTTIPLDLFDSTQFFVKLYPQELGDMVAELQNTQDGMTLRLFVESSTVKEILESNMQFFEDQLSQSKIPFSQIDVELRDFNQHSSQDSDPDMNLWDAFLYQKDSEVNRSSQNKIFNREDWEKRFSSSWDLGDTLLELFA